VRLDKPPLLKISTFSPRLPFTEHQSRTLRLADTNRYLIFTMGLSKKLAGLKLGSRKNDPQKPPFQHIPGFIWQYGPEEGVKWHLIPDTNKYTSNLAMHMGIKDAGKIPEGWTPTDGLIPGWKLPWGIAKYFPGGAIPGKKKPRRFSKVQDKGEDMEPLCG
jgi:hypothetical protein